MRHIKNIKQTEKIYTDNMPNTSTEVLESYVEQTHFLEC